MKPHSEHERWKEDHVLPTPFGRLLNLKLRSEATGVCRSDKSRA